MAQPGIGSAISELAPTLKTRTPAARDPYSMKARRGFRTTEQMLPGRRAQQREFARKR